MSLCCVCILTSPQKTVSALLNYLILSTGGRSHTALSEEGAQLFRNKSSNHLLPIRSAAAPRTFAGWGRKHTENTQVAAVYSAHAVTSLTCSWLSPVASSHTLVHLHAILCGSKHTCRGHYLGISQSTEKKTSNISWSSKPQNAIL